MKSVPGAVLASEKSGFPFFLLFAALLMVIATSCSGDGETSPTTSELEPPVVDNIPDQDIYEGEVFAAIPLDDYVDDADNSDPDISWSFTGNSQLTVAINSSRVATVTAPSDIWTGTETITFRATDPGGLFAENTAIFRVNAIEYAPAVLEDWPVSTPEQQGLDPALVKQLYHNAINLDREYDGHLYSVLVVKNGHLVAEKYFNWMTYNIATRSASVTKSYTSVLAGIALHQDNELSSLGQCLYEFFPEYNWAVMDPRKSEITIRQMLQMRSGYPWEEREGYMDEFIATNDWLDLLASFPLTNDPGTAYGYSNLTAHAVAVATARATGTQLSEFAQAYLFDPLGVTGGSWPTDAHGNNVGHGDMRIRPRDMAKFGLLMLSDGMYDGTQIVPSEWITESTQPYSLNIFGGPILYSFQQINYGYFWYSAMCGDHSVIFAWGHGGQLIVIVEDLDMVVVTTADNLLGDFTPEGWDKESAVLDIAGYFIGSIPNQ